MSKVTAGHGLAKEELKETTAAGTKTPIDASRLTDFLPAMAQKWFEIGLKLGCKDTAKSLGESPQPTPRKCFLVIDEWMMNEGENGNACWEYLCGVVLRSEGIGLGDVADRMERELKLKSSRQVSLQTGERELTDCGGLNVSGEDVDSPVDSSGLTVEIHRSESDMGGVEPPYSMLLRRTEIIHKNPDHDVWETQEECIKKMTIVLQDYFLKHQELGTDPVKVSEEVQSLQHSNFLLDDLKELAMSKADQYQKQMSDELSDTRSTVSSVGVPEEEPLFSKENVYHTLVSCLAVDASDESQARSILREHPHNFDGLSVTRSDCKETHESGGHHGMYLIARKTDGTYIVAFKGIPTLSEWLTHNSFEEGLCKQAASVPGKYFLQLIKNGSRVVFTGFAMGGALAGTVVSWMLDDSYMNKAILESRVACITFGHPLISDPTLHELVEKGGLPDTCLHHVHLQEDVVPVLLRYAFVQQAAAMKAARESGAAVKVSKSGLMLDKVNTLQKGCSVNPVATGSHEPSKKVINAIDWAQEKVECMTKQGDVKQGKPPLPCGQYYLVKPVPKKGVAGFVWETLSREEAERKMSCLPKRSLSLLGQDTIRKHTARNYFRCVHSAFIDAPEHYVLPEVKGGDLEPLVTEALVVKSVDVHCYDTEVVVILSGSNLWFTRELNIHDIQDLCLCLQANAAHEVQARAKILKEVASFIRDLPRHGIVCVGSCFLPASKADVEFHAKNLLISDQNTQVAKLAPLQLIALSFLTTVLEKRGQGSPCSEQFCATQAFLEVALETVPAEGLLIAACSAPHVNAFFRQLLPSLINHIRLLPSQVMFDSILHYVSGTVPKHQMPEVLIYFKQMLPPDVSTVMDQPRPQLDVRCQKYLLAQAQNIEKALKTRMNPPTLCGEGLSSLLVQGNDPVQIIKSMRENVECIAARQVERYSHTSMGPPRPPCNKEYLEAAREASMYATCIAFILDSFMSMQVQVPFVRTPKATAEALNLACSTEEGGGDIWGLVGWKHIVSQTLTLSNPNPDPTKLESKEMEPLMVNVSRYLGRYLGCQEELDSMGYSSKVHFICNAMSNAVSYSRRFISCSLEMQLKALCKERGITAGTTIMDIRRRWDECFGDTALCQVATSFRPILARWIKWMLITHKLRVSMAKRTTLGIVGLMNSGKSHLLNSLFQTKAPTGTLEEKRTTVPLVYTMDPEVRMLSVIDFPGVDDCDKFIQRLCRWMLEVVQVAVFVVDYRKAHSQPSMNWLSVLAKSNIPVLVCLTHADKLVAEAMPEPGVLPDPSESQKCVEETRQEFCLKYREHFFSDETPLRSPPECVMACFTFDKDSIFASGDGSKYMAEAGIKSALFVASWILEQLNRLGLQTLAKSLEEFLHKNKVL